MLRDQYLPTITQLTGSQDDFRTCLPVCNQLVPSPGGPFTGAALNPARVLGPTLVFDCFWNTAFIYVFGQLLGGLLAALLVPPLYGFGQFGSVFDTRIFGWLGLSSPQRFQQASVKVTHSYAVYGWPCFWQQLPRFRYLPELNYGFWDD